MRSNIKINWASIVGKYEGYIDSEDGQKRIQSTTSSGKGGSVNTDYMINAANKLIEYIQNEFYSFYTINSAESVREIIDEGLVITMAPTKIGVDNGVSKYQIDVGFLNENALKRESLRKSMFDKKRTGDGIDNIISLYDTGGGNKQVYGYWETREDYNMNIGDPPYIATPVPVFTRTAFMLSAVNKFNQELGEVYNCVATISAPDPRFYVRQ